MKPYCKIGIRCDEYLREVMQQTLSLQETPALPLSRLRKGSCLKPKKAAVSQLSGANGLI